MSDRIDVLAVMRRDAEQASQYRDLGDDDAVENQEAGVQSDHALSAVRDLIAAAQAVSMLRQLGGIMPGSREVVMVAVEAAEAALARIQATT